MALDSIGLQLGPGFFAAFRQQGLKFNLLAAGIVLCGVVIAPVAGWLAGLEKAAVPGIFSGASTNTPSLGAATQTLASLPNLTARQVNLPAVAYAVTYPTAIVGIIGTLLFLKFAFRINAPRETEEFAAKGHARVEPLEHRTLLVTNPKLDGVRIDSIPARVECGVTISRVRGGNGTVVATDPMHIHCSDRMLVVGTSAALEQFERVVGERSEEDLLVEGVGITDRRVVVTERSALGKTIHELDLDERFQVAVTRVTRADLGMNVIHEDDTVYVDGKPVSAEKYDGPLLEAAQTVAQPPPPLPPSDPKQQGDWLPLGVFALAQEERGEPVMFFQLSVNREGAISGAFQSRLTNDSKQVAGKVDKSSQRAAWRIGDNGKTIYETTLANLTQEVSPIAIHFDTKRTQTWLMVRMPAPAQTGQKQKLPQAPKTPPPLKVAKKS